MSVIGLALNDPAAQRVRELWTLLEERFGISGVRTVPFPHLTLLGFDGLTHPQVKDLLARISQATAPFPLETMGIGIFNDPAPVIYAPVVKAPSLFRLHRALYEELRQLGGIVPDLFSPARWVPHVTLAQGQPLRGSYGDAVECLMAEKLRIPFEVRNLTLFDWVGPRYEPCERFPLTARSAKQRFQDS